MGCVVRLQLAVANRRAKSASVRRVGLGFVESGTARTKTIRLNLVSVERCEGELLLFSWNALVCGRMLLMSCVSAAAKEREKATGVDREGDVSKIIQGSFSFALFCITQ